jgi:hypothetical protein
MKNLFVLFVFLFFSATLSAQKVYFIYLQTENLQPFYARMGERIYNSNPAGYLILSNLRDSSYSINIGMQGNQAPDQPYSISVNRKDQGFLLKNLGDRGWGLFNLSTMAVIMPASNPATSVQTVKTEKREDNAFTNLLARAADDSTIKERPIIEKPVEKKVELPAQVITEKKEEEKNEIKTDVPDKQEESKKEIVPIEKKEEPKVDSAAILKQIEDANRAAQLKTDSIAVARNREAELLRREELRKQDSIDKANTQTVTNTEYKRSVVKLRSESSTTMGIGLVFLDMQADNITDTIRILIPPENKKTGPADTRLEEKRFLDISSGDSVKKDDSKPAAVRNNNCRTVATDDDFFKLRKKMVAEKNDNSMISEASKVFKTKCLSTIQIKNLSALFLTDEYRYKFFDAAYQYVSDAENFASLESELKDEYYVNRFKAMLRF